MNDLPLFPLQAVLFPDGLLKLKVFEARYIDLMSRCLRNTEPFGVVCLRQGSEVKGGNDPVNFEFTGTLAEIIDIDSTTAGVLHVQCRGAMRFTRTTARSQADGLWTAHVNTIPNDVSVIPPANMLGTVKALARATQALRERGPLPFLSPLRFDDAGWVANRWSEILPISLEAKQRLMELPDATARLQLVTEYLRSNGVLSD